MAVPPTTDTGRTLVYDGLAQNDIDMAHHRLINLDTSNLPPIGIPPSVDPPDNEWLHSWNAETQTWESTRPTFEDIGPDNGTLTQDQQRRISALGDIRIGVWNGTPLSPTRVPTLDLIRAPLGNLFLNNKRITNLANPVDAGDAVNKGFMDFLLLGLQPKEAVRCASGGRSIVLTGLGPVDGVDLEVGDRVLVKDYPSSYLNGIYIADVGHWERSEDADSTPKLLRAYCTVLEGDINGGTSWVESTPIANDPPEFGDIIEFLLFSQSAGTVIAGTGLTRDGNTLNVGGTPGRISVDADTVDIDPSYVGQSSITTVGIIGSGTWRGSIIGTDWGGTGVDNGTKFITICGNLSTEIPFDFPDVGGGRNATFLLKDHTQIYLPPTGTVATTSGIETFKNKNIVKRTIKIASNPKPAINVNVTDVFHITNLVDNITSMTDNLTGTPDNGQELFIWMFNSSGAIGPSGTSVAWGAKFTASTTLPLPVLLPPFTRNFMWFIYNDDIAKWVLTQSLGNMT